MAKFSDQRKGGRNYTVVVTDTKDGDKVRPEPFAVTAAGPKQARAAAIKAAEKYVIDPARLYAHAPQRA